MLAHHRISRSPDQPKAWGLKSMLSLVSISQTQSLTRSVQTAQERLSRRDLQQMLHLVDVLSTRPDLLRAVVGQLDAVLPQPSQGLGQGAGQGPRRLRLLKRPGR